MKFVNLVIFHCTMVGGTSPCQVSCMNLSLDIVELLMFKHNRTNGVKLRGKVYHRLNKFSQETHWQAATGLTQLCICSLHQSQTHHKFSSPYKLERKLTRPQFATSAAEATTLLLYISGNFLLRLLRKCCATFLNQTVMSSKETPDSSENLSQCHC